jgi:hypothetical protein
VTERINRSGRIWRSRRCDRNVRNWTVIRPVDGVEPIAAALLQYIGGNPIAAQLIDRFKGQPTPIWWTARPGVQSVWMNPWREPMSLPTSAALEEAEEGKRIYVGWRWPRRWIIDAYVKQAHFEYGVRDMARSTRRWRSTGRLDRRNVNDL